MEQEKILTQGEMIDKMTIQEIVDHPKFISLEKFAGIPGPSYYEIKFEAEPIVGNSTYKTFFGQVIPFRHFKCYKIIDQ